MSVPSISTHWLLFLSISLANILDHRPLHLFISALYDRVRDLLLLFFCFDHLLLLGLFIWISLGDHLGNLFVVFKGISIISEESFADEARIEYAFRLLELSDQQGRRINIRLIFSLHLRVLPLLPLLFLLLLILPSNLPSLWLLNLLRDDNGLV